MQTLYNRKLIWVPVTALLLSGGWSLQVLAQQAPTRLLPPQGAPLPDVDNNLNGINDADEDDAPAQQPVQFETTLPGDGDDTENDDANQPADLRRTNSPIGQLRNTLSGTDGSQDGNARARRADPVGIIGPDGQVTPLANLPAAPVQGGNPTADESPFAALGIRRGSFTFFPVVTQSVGTTTNADFSSDGASSVFSRTELRLTGISDWALHELRGEIGGSYETFFNGTSDSLPTFDANLQLRVDHSNQLTATYGANYALTTESAVSDNLSVPTPLTIDGRPNVHRYGGFAEVAKQTGRWNGSLRGTVTHSVFEGADISDGSRLPQGDRTNTFYELNARLGYETSVAFQPFAEASIGTRRFFRKIDRNGNRRNSVLYGLRGGVAFNQGEKFNGELAVGYNTEQFNDSALNDLSGVTIDGTINWSPQRFTTVSATAQTAFTGSTNANEAGSVTYAASLGVVRDVRPNLSLNARVLASFQTFDGSAREDQTLQASVGAEWRLNRNVAVTGTLGYETVDSTEAGSSYNAATALVGIRLQR